MKKIQLNAPGKGQFVYDYKYDILTFKIKDRNYKRSVEFQNFTIDIDDKEFVTGVRIFDASQTFGVDKYVLKNITGGEFKASIENDAITITLKFIGKLRNKLIPIIPLGEKQSYTQQITAPVGANQKLSDSVVECKMEA